MPAQIQTPEGQALRQAQTDAGSTPLDNVTVAQAVTYVQSTVISLPTAVTVLVVIVKVLIQQQRRIARLEKIVSQK